MLLAALLALAVQTPPDADPAAAAGMGFAACLQSFAASTSKAAFVKLEHDLGQSLDADPHMGHHGFSIDDAGGRGCAITYTGDASKATRLADAYTRFSSDCPQRQADATGVTCPAGSGSPPFRIEVRRSTAAGGHASIVATLIDLRP